MVFIKQNNEDYYLLQGSLEELLASPKTLKDIIIKLLGYSGTMTTAKKTSSLYHFC
jgi:hypothetical protein